MRNNEDEETSLLKILRHHMDIDYYIYYYMVR
jgi:hypothetical protein